VYDNDAKKMANDLILIILAALDTSRNSIIIAMVYLIRNKESRDKILQENKAYSLIKNLQEETQLNPTKEELGQHFKFLHKVISESMRINPPSPASDFYVITKDVEHNGIKWTKGTNVCLNIYVAHHD